MRGWNMNGGEEGVTCDGVEHEGDEEGVNWEGEAPAPIFDVVGVASCTLMVSKNASSCTWCP